MRNAQCSPHFPIIHNSPIIFPSFSHHFPPCPKVSSRCKPPLRFLRRRQSAPAAAVAARPAAPRGRGAQHGLDAEFGGARNGAEDAVGSLEKGWENDGKMVITSGKSWKTGETMCKSVGKM